MLPVVLFWLAVAFWASGTLVFWTSVYFGTESQRRARESSYHNPYAELEVIGAPLFSAGVWLPLLLISVLAAASSRTRGAPYPRFALAIVWLVYGPILIVCVLAVGFYVFVGAANYL